MLHNIALLYIFHHSENTVNLLHRTFFETPGTTGGVPSDPPYRYYLTIITELRNPESINWRKVLSPKL